MTPLARARAFSRRYGTAAPIMLAPMAGASAPSLSIAVSQAGGLGACGALLFSPDQIARWAAAVRAGTPGPFQINLWVPDPPPQRETKAEAAQRAFLSRFGPEPPASAGDAAPPDFAAQFDALVEARPAIASSVMGLFPPSLAERLRQVGIDWWATATTLAEARAAADAGAQAIVAQGMEAGGHRGSFDASRAERDLVGLTALVPAVVDATGLPVIAAGGVADGRGLAAALALGASAVQVGTAFLRSPEAQLPPAWADGLARAAPEATALTRAFSGRAGRALATDYVRAAADPGAPAPAPYPVQRGLTATMRAVAGDAGDLQRMQAWAGQSAALARAEPAGEIVQRMWREARSLLGEE